MENKDLKNRIKNMKVSRSLRPHGSWNFPFSGATKGEAIKRKVDKEIENNPDINFSRQLDVCSMDVSYIDLSLFSSDFITFDSKTKFSSEDSMLPKDFSAQQVMDECMNPGLNVSDLHKRGIDGKGINIAIIDQPLSNHQEYDGKIKHYEEVFKNGTSYNHSVMHGPFVTSLAIGDNCGAAPGAECYYFATSFVGEGGKQSSEYIAKALERVMEINESLPVQDKIQIVSVSGCFEEDHIGFDDWKKAFEKAKKAGITVITGNLERDYGLTYSGLQRDVNSDLNNSESYSIIDKKIDKRVGDKWISEDKEKNLLFPCDHRTGASHQGKDQYMHASRGGISWIVPHIAGMYAMAKQVNPECTLEHFWKIGLETGHKKEGLNGIVANPVALIGQLQMEKVLQNKLLNNKEIS